MGHTLKKVTSEFGNSNFGKKNIKNKSKKSLQGFRTAPYYGETKA